MYHRPTLRKGVHNRVVPEACQLALYFVEESVAEVVPAVRPLLHDPHVQVVWMCWHTKPDDTRIVPVKVFHRILKKIEEICCNHRRK